MMNKTMKQYKGKVLKAMMMLLAVGFALAGTSTLSSCSSDDDPYFTVSEDDNPRILNTDLADSKIDRKTNYKLEIKVTPVHYTTVTWLLDGTQIAEGNTIDQTLPVGIHELKIVATTTKGKSTSRTLKVTVTPAADDPALGTNAVELWVAPGAETTIQAAHLIGIRTRKENLLTMLQRKDITLVLQEHHTLGSSLQGELGKLLTTKLRIILEFLGWVLEEVKTVLHAKHTTAGIIDTTHRNLTFLHQFYKVATSIARIRFHNHVDTSIDGNAERILLVLAT